MQPAKRLEINIASSIRAKQAMLEDIDFMEAFNTIVETVVRCYRNGGRLYIAGNGGSAADALHLACEFVARLARERAPLPAEALVADASAITAIGNDYGFEFIFSRQLVAKAVATDVFLAISTSGNSRNIVNALEECRRLNIPSILLTGPDGGKAKTIADYVLRAQGDGTCSIQEQHIVIYHTLCECVESAVLHM